MKKSIGANSTHKVIFGASKLLALSAKPVSVQNEATRGAINQIPSVIRLSRGRINCSAKKKELLMGKNCIESCRTIIIFERQTTTTKIYCLSRWIVQSRSSSQVVISITITTFPSFLNAIESQQCSISTIWWTNRCISCILHQIVHQIVKIINCNAQTAMRKLRRPKVVGEMTTCEDERDQTIHHSKK